MFWSSTEPYSAFFNVIIPEIFSPQLICLINIIITEQFHVLI